MSCGLMLAGVPVEGVALCQLDKGGLFAVPFFVAETWRLDMELKQWLGEKGEYQFGQN